MTTLSQLKIVHFAFVHVPDLLGGELRLNNSLALPPIGHSCTSPQATKILARFLLESNETNVGLQASGNL